MKTIGVLTNNHIFFESQKETFLRDTPLLINGHRAAHGKDGTSVLQIRPDCIEIDACGIMFDILIFEFPTHLPTSIQ